MSVIHQAGLGMGELSPTTVSGNTLQPGRKLNQSPSNRAWESDPLGFFPDARVVITPEPGDLPCHPNIGQDGDAGSLQRAGDMPPFVWVVHTTGLDDPGDDLGAMQRGIEPDCPGSGGPALERQEVDAAKWL